MREMADFMNSTVFLSTFSVVVLTVSAFILVKRRHFTRLNNSVFTPLFIAVSLYDLIVISNILEHSSISSYFDPVEDIAEIVFSFLFLFFVNNWQKDYSEARFKELFKLAPMALAEVDRDGRIVEVNEVLSNDLDKLYGIKIDEITSLNSWWELLYPDLHSREKVVAAWQDTEWQTCKQGLTVNSGETQVTCVDGTKRTLMVNASVVGKNILISLFDITALRNAEDDREKLQKQLFQSQKLESIGTLAGGVAHDFNNIIGSIMGYSELTINEMKADDPLRKYIERILDASERSASLVRQLLIFARKQTTVPEVLDLNTAVDNMLNILRRLIGENIELIWIPGENSCPVKMDPSRLDQILANLCVNARDAISDVGKITIKTRKIEFDELACRSNIDSRPGSYIQLSVMDNGCGMDRETSQHVFDPFFTTKGPGRGTGLGLATVYGIVRQAQGFINLYSETGIGTSFNIYIPFYEGELEAKADKVSSPVPQGRGETILLVEDDAELINMTRLMLEHLGYKVLTAVTPNEAVRLAGNEPGEIDLFLTDVIMPDMNGRELIDRLLQIRPDVKYIFMSGYTADIVVHQGVSQFDKDFIQKPFSLNILAEKVREVLDAD